MFILNNELKNMFLLSNRKIFRIHEIEASAVKNQFVYYPSSTKEWYNSVYNFHKNQYIKTLPIKDIYTYKLFDAYFNYNTLKNYNGLSITKIFISKPEIKHFNNKINITLYIFNRQKIYLLQNILICKNLIDLYNKNKNKFFKDKITHNIELLKNLISKQTKYKFKSLNFIILYKFYFYIKSIYLVISFFINKYKFNVQNLLFIKNMLSGMYSNNIQLNIVNLKYLCLDSNILAVCIARKLRNRNVRVLRLIRMALKLSKKPYMYEYYTYYLNTNIDALLIKKNFNIFSKEIPSNFSIILKPYVYINRVILYYLNNKIISGIKIQGAGRLTKRLTASRSINKSSYKGSLKNNKSTIKGLSSTMLKGYVKSNLQYINANSYNAIGAYGIKNWISSS